MHAVTSASTESFLKERKRNRTPAYGSIKSSRYKLSFIGINLDAHHFRLGAVLRAEQTARGNVDGQVTVYPNRGRQIEGNSGFADIKSLGVLLKRSPLGIDT